jgi:predicted nucleotidyltransferase
MSLYNKCERFYIEGKFCSEIFIDDRIKSSLININAISTAGDKVFINFENELVFSFKKSYDMLSLYNLHSRHINSILKIRDEIKKISNNKLLSVVLVGSYARNTASETSDYDFLIISDSEIVFKKTEQNKRIEIISYTPSKFENSLLSQDEFIIWGLKYGLVIYDNNYLNKFYPLNETKLQKLKKRKKELLERLVYRTVLSIGSCDTRTISTRIKDLKKQIMRSAIIALDCVPKSSPELPGQFKKCINDTQLSDRIIMIDSKEKFTKYYLMDNIDTLRKFYFEWLRNRL